MRLHPGYQTIGIVVDNGSVYSRVDGTNSELQLDKVIVRIPEVHGTPNTDDQNWTQDIDLPRARIQLSPGMTFSEKYAKYKNGAWVNVVFPSGDPEHIWVTGIVADADNAETDGGTTQYLSTVIQEILRKLFP